MSSTDSTATPVEVDPHPNREVIDGLREVADWLAEHPELPRAYYASVSFSPPPEERDVRERLSELGEALGGQAREYAYGDYVTIEATFGRVGVSASALKSALLPELEPIIAGPVVEERAA